MIACLFSRPTVWIIAIALLGIAEPVLGQDQRTLTFDQPETAGIAGYRVMWDKPVLTDAQHGVRTPGDKKVEWGDVAPSAGANREEGSQPAALAFDAIHRSLLVRFPDAAARLAQAIEQGYRIEKATLVLPYEDVEIWPEGSSAGVPREGGYNYRTNWGTDKRYRAVKPTWHAIAYALRQPWRADAELGPTYNAFINGVGYWGRFGAQDPSADRVPHQFGPTPVHHENPTGHMDITRMLTDEAFGDTLGQRLRNLADKGLMLRKWETYDHRYYTGAYEWSTATGPRAIVIDQPRLEVTLKKADKKQNVDLPPATDIDKLAQQLKQSGEGGKPTAVIPSRDELKQLAREFQATQPDWMPDWQWKRVTELFAAAYGEGAEGKPLWFQFVPGYIKGRYRLPKGQEPPDDWQVDGHDPEQIYLAWVDQTLGKPYRGWHGFEAASEILPWFVYRDAMPAPVHDWYQNYWTAWLMPGRETAATDKQRKSHDYVEGPLVHPMADDPRVDNRVKSTPDPTKGQYDTYYAATGDWRGNKSFYRSGFNYTISTTNFNNTASMGALLGGAIIGSEHAIADGRHGQANYPLKLWTWYDGSTQEELDDYYFGITVMAQKMVADFGPDTIDRMLGRSMLNKSMTMLAEDYHPGLRRYLAGASRTATNYRLASQEGLYAILHTLSKRGTVTDMGKDKKDMIEGFDKWGHDLPPQQVARQALNSPYAPLWYQQVIDEKPLPFQVTAAYKQWGGHNEHPIMRRSYLAENYGLYSANSASGNIPIIAHWRREAQTPEASRAIGTLIPRFGANRTQLVNEAGGWIGERGAQATLQHKGKLILASSPYHLAKEAPVHSIQSSIALYNYEAPERTWELYVDGKRVTAFPHSASASQRITIRDGVSYIGIIPLAATDLGRDAQVIIRPGQEQSWYGKYSATAALVIDNYNYRSDTPLEMKADDPKWRQISNAHNGFVIEIGDVAEFGSFDAFQKHIMAAQLDQSFTPETNLHTIAYTSGDDSLEMAAHTDWGSKDKLDKLFDYQRINGQPAYLPEGVDRDSDFSIQSRSGTLEKGGAVLEVTDGQLAVLQREPNTGIVHALNPLAELNDFKLTTPEGVTVKPDGKLGLATITVDAANNRVVIEHAFLEKQKENDAAAKVVRVTGLNASATIILNGQTLEPRADGDELVVPLQ